ncbi:MAG: DUF4118 domain-containing protein [Deltaproteobacteria bacterium]|nr:DUF4118 domain-containing protein [Deltaproteobacteria bacterium]
MESVARFDSFAVVDVMLRRLLGAAGGVLAVLVATAVASIAGANPSTAGFLFLIVVLFTATEGGFTAGACASIAATATFNFYFLPPVGTFHVAATENWAALAAFLTVAGLTSRLVAQAKEEARRAQAQAREVEAVSALSVGLLAAAHDQHSLAAAAASALLATGARSAGMVVYENEGGRVLAWKGEMAPPSLIERAVAARACVQAVSLSEDSDRDLLVPLLVGGESMGVLVSLGSAATRSAVESVAKVLTLALERERLLREQAHMEALRESEALKSALLGAVSHDLSTPLTAIGFQVDALKRKLAGAEAYDGVVELEAEVLRLRRRIEGLLAIGRLEAGNIAPRPEPVPAADLFRWATESLPLLRRPLDVKIGADCADVYADPSLVLEIIVNLLENADRASGEGAAIELVATSDAGTVRLGVLDRGRGMAGVAAGAEIVLDDVLPRGLGLEIARRLAAAGGGSVSLQSRRGGGVAAWVCLPAARVEAVS